jgi:Rrf2 family protein
MKFSLLRRTDLAIGALRALADSGTRMRAGDLGQRIGASPGFVPQVMAPLTKAGWVDSARGPTGGYRIQVSLDKISVLEVIEAVEGPVDTTTCVLRGGPCGSSELCSVHFPIQEARTALLARLASVPVDSRNYEEPLK